MYMEYLPTFTNHTFRWDEGTTIPIPMEQFGMCSNINIVQGDLQGGGASGTHEPPGHFCWTSSMARWWWVLTVSRGGMQCWSWFLKDMSVDFLSVQGFGVIGFRMVSAYFVACWRSTPWSFVCWVKDLEIGVNKKPSWERSYLSHPKAWNWVDAFPAFLKGGMCYLDVPGG